MQVSSKLFNQQQMSQFSEINSDIQNLQSKISSGKNILAASDNPIVWYEDCKRTTRSIY